MYKRLAFWLLAGGVLLGATSCYKDVMDMEVDPIRPEFILPVLRDTLRVEQLLTREQEHTSFEYEADGTCVAVYRDKQEIESHGLSSRVTLKPGVYSQDIDVESTTSQVYAFPWEILPAREVKQVSFRSADKFKIVITAKAESADATQVKGKITWQDPTAPITKEFAIPANGEGEIDITEEIKSGRSFQFYDGTYYNKCPFMVSDLEVVGAPAGSKKVKLSVGVNFMNLILKEAIGHTKLNTSSKTVVSFSRKIDIFSSMRVAKANLPESSVSIRVSKDPKTPAKLSVAKIEAVPSEIREDSPAPINVVNQNLDALSEEQKGKSLLIGGAEQSLGDAASKTFILNNSNSNIADIFGNALFDLKVSNVALALENTGISQNDEPLPLDSKIVYEMEVRIPFYGMLKTSKMLAEMKLADNTFPKDASDYLQNKDNTAGIDQAIALHIGILNTLPMDGYAKLEFLDKAKNKVMELTINNEGGKAQEGANLFIPCGEVNSEGRVDKPAFREHVHQMTKEQYENLSNNAKTLRTTYYFITPEGKNVRVKKDDNVLLQVAVDVKAYGKPSDLIKMGDDFGKKK